MRPFGNQEKIRSSLFSSSPLCRCGICIEPGAQHREIGFTSTSSMTQPVERDFAESLEKNEAVKENAKLPGWFKVPTPLGTYNPDWAVLGNAGWPGTTVLCR